jgi:hypothetical protein
MREAKKIFQPAWQFASLVSSAADGKLDFLNCNDVAAQVVRSSGGVAGMTAMI